VSLEGFHFANPGWLYGIPALLLSLGLFYLASRAKRSVLFVGNPRLVESAPGFFSVQLIPWALRFLVLFLCLLAAARPQAGQKKVEEKRPVTDLFVTFDVSSSMLIEDLKPNRVTAAKKILSNFLDQVQDARVGLTVFAQNSFTQCPLTTDIAVVKQLLDNVDVFSVKSHWATAIGDALISSLGRLQSGALKKEEISKPSGPSFLSRWVTPPKEESDDEGQNNQAIILLTDGGNNAGSNHPLAAAKLAISRGVKIYSIGVGSRKSVPAIFTYRQQEPQGNIDPRTGRIAMSEPVDMSLLNEIARITGGKAYMATDNRSLKSILDDIARLEKREIKVATHWEYQELAAWFLLAAFFLLVLGVSLEMTVLRTLP
jgi:Ca-activated chloride channel homolog